jgi:hypothetical protein
MQNQGTEPITGYKGMYVQSKPKAAYKGQIKEDDE